MCLDFGDRLVSTWKLFRFGKEFLIQLPRGKSYDVVRCKKNERESREKNDDTYKSLHPLTKSKHPLTKSKRMQLNMGQTFRRIWWRWRLSTAASNAVHSAAVVVAGPPYSLFGGAC
jgi:hypothetical protein